MRTNFLFICGIAVILTISWSCSPRIQPPQRTSLDATILPLSRAHAHNDYQHDHPLQDALNQGFTSVEADVLHKKQKLYVGHTKLDLLSPHTPILEDLYLKPLQQRYLQQEGEIYKNYPEQFYLWIDIKYDKAIVYPLLKKALMPYKEMLTYYEDGQLHAGKVTVILSGDRPIDAVLEDRLQLMTLDGRLGDLDKNYPSTLMPFVSEHWKRIFQLDNKKQISTAEFLKLKTFIKKCHEQGKKTRLWATPEEEALWKQLLTANADLINADDLEKLATFLQQQ